MHGARPVVAALVLLLASAARAVDFEKLVMPGPVIEGHAEIEGQCGKCHDPFDASAQRKRCLACHDDVGADLRAGAGFHGRAPAARSGDCRSCHAEHKGRDFDATGLDPHTFEHGFTDQPLRGAHARVACASCHLPGKAWRDAPSACVDCHREDDAHHGRLGADCGACHGVDSFAKRAKFSHDETGFPLEGRHANVDCALCHPGQRYEDTARDCYACHRLDDVHLGRFGRDCATCHTPRGFEPARFDHARTGFALRGRHGEVACEACHTGPLHEKKLPSDCVGCHREEDVHRGRNGEQCGRCHDTRDWSGARFDHERTDFPLHGAHASLRCESCHTGRLEDALPKTCVGCHRDEDVHRGQEGTDCGRCHQETGWDRDLFFEHDLTAFPLLGLHAVVACEQCHASPAFKDAETRCIACHAKDDAHAMRLGPDCALCHNPNGWRVWRFDHDKQTRFPLGGAHAELACGECHRSPSPHGIAVGTTCASCHERDDRHHGEFGRDCSRCHGDSSWSEVTLRR
ncbi:MAG TPA: cytochrome c3 family protein [Myxococcota bacterium]|nr:cytochrome c3 family protein [Myxococcota bacterium]